MHQKKVANTTLANIKALHAKKKKTKKTNMLVKYITSKVCKLKRFTISYKSYMHQLDLQKKNYI
jgi:hypothetical protein